jgi:hypothetical protein
MNVRRGRRHAAKYAALARRGAELAGIRGADSAQVRLSNAEKRDMPDLVTTIADDGSTMLNSPAFEAGIAPALPLIAAADLQDNLMTASNDLERLQDLLSHACDELMQGFHGAAGEIRELVNAAHDTPSQELFDNVMQHLGTAITALQFQDMASQLIAHTNRRLRNCADRIARESMGGDDDEGFAVVEDAPLRPNPVTQDEMDAGSIELF